MLLSGVFTSAQQLTLPLWPSGMPNLGMQTSPTKNLPSPENLSGGRKAASECKRSEQANAHGVKAEMHIYADGGHGYRLRRTEFAVSG
jgi:hypothetical protein